MQALAALLLLLISAPHDRCYQKHNGRGSGLEEFLMLHLPPGVSCGVWRWQNKAVALNVLMLTKFGTVCLSPSSQETAVGCIVSLRHRYRMSLAVMGTIKYLNILLCHLIFIFIHACVKRGNSGPVSLCSLWQHNIKQECRTPLTAKAYHLSHPVTRSVSSLESVSMRL